MQTSASRQACIICGCADRCAYWQQGVVTHIQCVLPPATAVKMRSRGQGAHSAPVKGSRDNLDRGQRSRSHSYIAICMYAQAHITLASFPGHFLRLGTKANITRAASATPDR